jgi:D-xylose transport system ATP-binding protein
VSVTASTPGIGAGREAAAAPVPVLSVRDATKRFGSVLALDGVSFDVRRGEVTALLGDNGAGKSTLIKCISGVHRLDSGHIELDGVPAVFHGPNDARTAGIETVYQDLALFDNFTPAQNFFAGRELGWPGGLPLALRFLSRRRMDRETRDGLARLQVSMPRGADIVALMSGGQRQAVAVARAAMFASKVVILDEPTAALGLRESRQVLNLIARLRQRGNAVVLITHNMEHVLELASRAVVLRQGRKVGEIVPTRTNQQELVSMIVGA